jgi:hypothetical protein
VRCSDQACAGGVCCDAADCHLTGTTDSCN